MKEDGNCGNGEFYDYQPHFKKKQSHDTCSQVKAVQYAEQIHQETTEKPSKNHPETSKSTGTTGKASKHIFGRFGGGFRWF